METSLFADIFRDAHVIDLDFSAWDQAIRMVVVALESTAFPQRRLPVHVVEFLRVRGISIRFAHHGTQLELGHFQWNIDDARIEPSDGHFSVHLSGSKHLPVTAIECEDIQMRPIDNQLLDRRFPGWNRPGSPVIRPGIGSGKQ